MRQHTLRRSTSTAGLGLHSGQRVSVSLHPAPIDHGIVFVRTDMPERPRIELGNARVCDTLLCTGVMHGNARVRTVEHLLAAIYALCIDNILVEIDAEEIPILDGSSAPWVHLFEDAGIEEQHAWRRAYQAMREFGVEQERSWLKVQPDLSFKRRVEIEFDHPSIDRTARIAETLGDKQSFIRKTGRARTFGFLHQVEELHAKGLAQGGSLENAMVLDQFNLINEDGLRMPDEFAQHKLLDLMGDLMILGRPLLGYVQAFRPGHALQAKFTQAALNTPGLLRAVRLTDEGVAPEDATQPVIAVAPLCTCE